MSALRQGETDHAQTLKQERARCVVISALNLVVLDTPLAIELVRAGASIETAFKRYWGVATPAQREALLAVRAEHFTGLTAN